MQQSPQEPPQTSLHEQAMSYKEQQLQEPRWMKPSKTNLILRMFSIIVPLVLFGSIFIYNVANYITNHNNTSSVTMQSSVEKVGDTITIDNISSTLVSASDKDAPGYLSVVIRIVNNSQDEYTYYASDFHLITKFGSIIDPEESGSGALAPTGHGKGTINFQIDDTHDTKLLWQPTGHSNDLSHVWTLNL